MNRINTSYSRPAVATFAGGAIRRRTSAAAMVTAAALALLIGLAAQVRAQTATSGLA